MEIKKGYGGKKYLDRSRAWKIDARSYKLSAASISVLINEQPKQVKAETMDALCMALECTPSDLWVFTPTPYKKSKQNQNKVVSIKKVSNGKLPPI